MKFWIGITDGDWYRRLAEQRPDELNFWRPSGRGAFKMLQPGAPFLFKLHSPNNFIVGGGFFVRDTVLPVSLAWDAFREKNGAASLSELVARINLYRAEPSEARDPFIGCTILADPFFFDRADWIPVPADWPKSVQVGKSYDTYSDTGRAVWEAVESRLASTPSVGARAQAAPPIVEREAAYYLAKARIGQGAFRVLVTDAYERRCAVTGEKTLPVLQACHIRPYAEDGPNVVSNGLLLRSDLHILFDRGYVTIDPEYRLEVSQRLREEFENGRHYYAMAGTRLAVVPQQDSERPAAAFLSWHNEIRFRG